jgi:transketolase
VPGVDGLDGEAVASAIRAARAETRRPSLICCKTIIGYGAPHRQGTAEAHGEALGVDEVAAARQQLGWPYPPFVVPDEIRAGWDHRTQGAALEAAWRELFTRYASAFPKEAREFERRMRGDLPENWRDTAAQTVEVLARQTAPQATRQSSQAALNALAPALPEILGGSADLTTSNSTFFKGAQTIVPQEDRGDYLHFGVREFGMTGFMNGVAAHGGFIPYGGTFLVFSDYARNAVRLACLMEQRVILVYTHDSIGLGEDGPTHQPIEQLASLRAIPHLGLWRPCDAAETAVAWTLALERRGPTALVLTRQGLAQQPRTAAQLAAIRRGGYVLIECSGTPEALVIATGSEIGIAATAVNALNAAGRRVRLVSMPSTDTFDAQDDGWREGVLPRAVTRRLAVEAGVTQCWWRYVGSTGRVLGIERFGASGKGPDVLAHFGFTADNVARQLRALLEV